MSTKTAPDPEPTPAPAPRDHFAVAAELDAARARLRELEPANRDYYLKRERAVARRRNLEAKHQGENPDFPFDPEMFTPPAHVPPQDAPIAREFHKLHYAVAGLEKELEAAKKAAIG